MFREPSKRVFGHEWHDLLCSFMANPAAVFRAMRTEQPYPVKVFFSFGSNPLMGTPTSRAYSTP